MIGGWRLCSEPGRRRVCDCGSGCADAVTRRYALVLVSEVEVVVLVVVIVGLVLELDEGAE